MAKVERKSHTEGKHTAPPIATGAKGDKRGFDRAKVCYSGAAAGERFPRRAAKPVKEAQMQRYAISHEEA
jgi:hypothetical protein